MRIQFGKQPRFLISACLFVVLGSMALSSTTEAASNLRLVNGRLYVTGDRYENYVFIQHDVYSGSLTVVIDKEPDTTNTYDVEDVTKIIVRTFGGDDSVNVSQSFDMPDGWPTVRREEDQPIQLDIHTCVGNDRVSVEGAWGKTRIVTSAGGDTVSLGSDNENEVLVLFPSSFSQTQIQGDLYISTGGHEDDVYIGNTDVYGKTRIYTGGGGDGVIIGGNAIPAATVSLEGEWGSGVYFEDDFTLLTGGSDDFVYVSAQFGFGEIAGLEKDSLISPPRVYLNGGAGRCDDLIFRSLAYDPIIRGFEDCNDDE